jgi:hypothetical protein
MRKALLLAALATLAMPALAQAKEIKTLAVCGPSGCEQAQSGDQRLAAFRGAFEGDGPGGGPPAVLAAVPAGEYYRLGIEIRGDDVPAGHFSIEMWYVAPNLIRFTADNGGSEPFKRVGLASASLLQELARDVKPFPRPQVIDATVNDKRVADPQKLNALFTGLPGVEDPNGDFGRKMATLFLKPDHDNPWFGAYSLLYMPETQVLMLDEPVKVERDTATLVAETGGFAPPPSADDGNGWGRPVGIGILVFWLVLASVLYVALTRRRREAAST